MTGGLGEQAADEVREDGTLRVRVLVGSCQEGEPIASATLADDEQAVSDLEGHRLSPGRYCLEARAFDGECNQVGEGRKVVDLPQSSGLHHVVVVRPAPRAARCCSCSCNRGTCLRIEEDCSACDAPPAPPVLRHPWNGFHTGSVHDPASLRPRFSWEGAPGATRYVVQLFRECDPSESSCEPTVETSVSAEDSAVDGSSTHTYRLETALEVTRDPQPRPRGSIYHWRVRSCSEAGCSSPGESRYLAVGRLRSDFDGDGWPELVTGASHTTLDSEHPEEGVVYVLDGGSEPLDSLDVSECDSIGRCHMLRSPTPQADADFGLALAAVGDVDGDGFSDLAVGAYRYDLGDFMNSGAIYLFRGGADGLQQSRVSTLSGPAPKSDDDDGGLGVSLVAVGDLDGDGFADLGAGEAQSNRAFVFYGGQPDGLSDEASGIVHGPADARFGRSSALGSPGDLDGDGLADLAVGAPHATVDGVQGAGSVFVTYGSRMRLSREPPAVPDLRITGAATPDRELGYTVAGGDFDGDGIADLTVGSHEARTVDLYLGGPGLPRSGRYDDVSSSVEMSDIRGFGYSLAIARGGDGTELVVGATEGTRSGGMSVGAMHVLDSSLRPLRELSRDAGHPGDGYGYVVAAIDLDASGRDDLVVGARFLDLEAGADDLTGSVFVYYEGSGDPVVLSTTRAGSELGGSVARSDP